MCDIMSSRIEANLGAVAGARLLDLPSDQTFTCDEFAAHQVRHGWVAGKGRPAGGKGRAAAEQCAVQNGLQELQGACQAARPRLRV